MIEGLAGVKEFDLEWAYDYGYRGYIDLFPLLNSLPALEYLKVGSCNSVEITALGYLPEETTAKQLHSLRLEFDEAGKSRPQKQTYFRQMVDTIITVCHAPLQEVWVETRDENDIKEISTVFPGVKWVTNRSILES